MTTSLSGPGGLTRQEIESWAVLVAEDPRNLPTEISRQDRVAIVREARRMLRRQLLEQVACVIAARIHHRRVRQED
jgi:hypothetical protein